MQKAGIRILNDGVLQVDASYRNLFLVKKQDYILERKGYQVYLFDALKQHSIIAVAMDSWLDDAYPAPVNSNDRRASAMVAWPSFQIYQAAYDSAPIVPSNQYRITVQIPNAQMFPEGNQYKLTIFEFNFLDMDPSISKSGLQIFDAQQRMVFDANFKPLKIVNFIQNSAVFKNTNGQGWIVLEDPMYVPFPINSGKRYAIAPIEISARFFNNYTNYGNGDGVVTSGGITVYDYYVLQKAGAYIYQNWIPTIVRDNPNSQLYAGMNTIDTYILDVTNY